MNNAPLRLTILPLFLLLFGCGTSEYQSRLDKNISGLSSSSKFAVLGGDTPVSGTPISLRLPTTMQAVDITDAQRGKFPTTLFELESLKAAYEGTIEDSNHGKLPYYIYVSYSSMGNSTRLPAVTWLGAIRVPSTGDCSSSPSANYTANTPEGGSVTWEEFHYRCKQKFLYTTPDNKQELREMDGTLVCLCRAENGQAIALMFRYPSSLDEQHGQTFDSDWIRLIGGCMKVEEAAK